MKKLAILAVFLLTSCELLQQKKPDPQISYLSQGPRMDMQQFFEGDIEAFAIVQDAQGKIIKSYTSKVYGEWDENKGLVKKKFYFNNGKKDSRTWLVTDNKNNTFDAVGHDMAEPARGKQMGNALQMLYALYVKENGLKTKVRFEDSYYLVNKNAMIATSIAKNTRGKVISKSTISLKKVKKSKAVKKSKEQVKAKSKPKSDNRPLSLKRSLSKKDAAKIELLEESAR